MSDVICKHCKNQVAPDTKHHCEEMQRAGLSPTIVPKVPDQDDDDCFVTSAVIANITDSSVIGTIIGGNPVGAIVGETLNSDVRKRADELEDDASELDEASDTSDNSDDGDGSDDQDDD